MPGRIFISYRRADSQYATDRIYDRLSAHFGSERVFMDIDDIPLGVNFRIYIDQQVSTSEIVLAVIGDHWISATDPEGNVRLENPGDFVRLELEATLKQGIKLIPLFIGGVQSIPAHRLPESLRELPMLNATRIRRGTDFEGDIDKLIRGVERIFAQQEATRQRNNAALQELKESTVSIMGQLSGFEALLIQEMRKRAQLEKQALEIEKQIKETLQEPGKQLHADVPALRSQVDALRDEIVELSFQIEERKQANQLREGRIQADADRIAKEKAESERIVKEKDTAERIAQEKAEANRIAKEKAEADRIAEEKAEADRFAKERAEEERLARERVQARKIAKEKAEANRIAKEKAEADRIAKEKVKAERLAKRQAAALKRRAAIAEFRAILGKVPVWVWGAGLAVIFLGVAGFIFGPSLVERLSAPPASMVEPTGVSQVVTGPQAPAGFLEWTEAISRSTPDHIEDFSLYTFGWQNELFSGHNLGDYISATGELVIVDESIEMQNYSIHAGYGSDFQLQFDFTPQLYGYGSVLHLEFKLNDQGQGNHFWIKQDGSWNYMTDWAGHIELLASGESDLLLSEEKFTISLTDKEGHIAILINDELLIFVDDSHHGEGHIEISFETYKPINVTVDNILFWDLSDNEYLVDPPEDQTSRFYSPIRQYLFDTVPTFEEDFENYQPYWDEMQVYYNEEKPVDLSQSVVDGVLDLHAIEGEDNGQFALKFPQMTGRAFAIQYDFQFTDPMNSGNGVTASVQTYWDAFDQQEGYSPYCDFWLQGQYGCGLYKWDDGGVTDLIVGASPPIDMESPHTYLVIFYYSQFAAFLDGYFLGYSDGLEFFDQQISINIGTNEDRQKFDAAVDDIKFWNLDGVVYQPWDENGETQLMQFPILEHLVSTEPTFHEDFETPQAYWNGMPVYQDDQQETSLAESVSNGAVHLDSRPEEMTHPFWDLTFSQLQQSADFALKFDVNLVEADRIIAFISSTSPGGYNFGMGVSDGSLGIELHRDSGEGEEEPEVLFSNGISFNKQTATVQLVSYQSNFFIFIDEYFLGYAAGVDVAENPEILIFVPADDDVTIVELDNIQYWNLDGVEVDNHEETTNMDSGLDIEYILAYVKSEISPTMANDFESSDMAGEWGSASDGTILTNLVQDGQLLLPQKWEETTFPVNGLFTAEDFLLEFDLNFGEEGTGGIGIVFRASQSANTYYRYNLSYSEYGAGGGIYSQSDGTDVRTTDISVISINEQNRVTVLVRDAYFGIIINGALVYLESGINIWGNENYFIRYGGVTISLDNVNFWNLDGVNFE